MGVGGWIGNKAYRQSKGQGYGGRARREYCRWAEQALDVILGKKNMRGCE